MAWSLPPAVPPPSTADLSLLFRDWSAGKAWQWLRAGLIPWDDPRVQDRLALLTFQDLGVHASHLSNVWHMRQGDLEPLWNVPLETFPAQPGQPWPETAAALEGSAVGLLFVLVANGWNAFRPFIPATAPANSRDKPALREAWWGIEVVMGGLGQVRVEPGLRLALMDQMMRSPHCPSVETLANRLVCRKKNGSPLPWVHAAVRSREVLAFRACLAHGLDVARLHEGRAAWQQAATASEQAWWKEKHLEQALAKAAERPPRRARM